MIKRHFGLTGKEILSSPLRSEATYTSSCVLFAINGLRRGAPFFILRRGDTVTSGSLKITFIIRL